MKVCLVTIAIGEKYLEEYNQLFRPSQETYAKNQGYDFRVITDFLDDTIQDQSTISFNKILVCNQSWSYDYDFIIFVDADIYIHPKSPPIHLCTDFGDKIGIVNEFDQPSFTRRKEIQYKWNWEPTPTIYYRRSGFHIQTDFMLNTGVLVMQPKKHADYLKTIYNKYILKSINHPRGFNYEQSCIGYELQKDRMFEIMPNTFNALWFFYKFENYPLTLTNFSKQVYFIHFAGLKKSDHNIISLYKNNESN